MTEKTPTKLQPVEAGEWVKDTADSLIRLLRIIEKHYWALETVRIRLVCKTCGTRTTDIEITDGFLTERADIFYYHKNHDFHIEIYKTI
jgi:hypothetical protein